MILTLKKCPDEPGELEAWSTECLPWRVMQGLQRNVIAMAFCCKKGGGQKWEQLPPPNYTQLLVSRS
jgi:hypothetical protein